MGTKVQEPVIVIAVIIIYWLKYRGTCQIAVIMIAVLMAKGREATGEL